MECTLDIKLSASDIVSILALLVAGLSALYARWTWSEAEKANKISLLGHRKEIYDAFFELKMHMMQKAETANISEVSKFYYHSKNAKIYLPINLAEDIDKYYDACFWIAESYRSNGGVSYETDIKNEPHIKTEIELSTKIEKALIELLQEAQA